MTTPFEAVLPHHLWRIWAKWSKTGKNAPEEGETYHPLICHMLDVATVARHLWRSALPAPTRERLTQHLGLSDESVAAIWIAFFTGSHDIGKASPGFQDQLNDTSAGDTIRGWMREARLSFADAEWVAHGAVSARTLGCMLQDYGVDPRLADEIAALVGGHHGVFPRQEELDGLKDRQQVGYGRWDSIRNELLMALRAGLHVPDLAPSGEFTPADAMVFAGFVTVADWIGSNEFHFRHAGRLAAAPQPLSLAAYTVLADQSAAEALRTVRLDPFAGASAAVTRRRTFSELFPTIPKPNDAQKAVIELADHLTGPALVTLEAPMGEGKTEAALYLAESWAAIQDRQGAYIALPTQATSNQMFGRMFNYLHTRFSNTDYVAAHLVYGEALFNDTYQAMLDKGRTVLSAAQSASSQTVELAGSVADLPDTTDATDAAVSDSAGENTGENEETTLDEMPELECEGPVYDQRGDRAGAEGAVVAVEWFAAPKRALLAPYGVGTIDQALLGVLQTKHFFVRLFGLAGKTVIVDEVHAYDTYMSALLDRLLEWLGAFGVPVVLLSATLPRVKRAQLQAAYARFAGWPATGDATGSAHYPRLTWLNAEGAGAREVAVSSTMSHLVEVEWLDDAGPDSAEGLAALGNCLAEALRGGGCAAVVCNTVGRAQAVYSALRQCFQDIPDDQRPEVDLFHARFLRGSRADREARVLSRFGKGRDGQRNPKRPRRAVLVATQVIEQSLDLDFDLMVSDLAPVDLLLQRSGRLHRHRENDLYRPAAVKTARLLIPRPQERDGCPQFPKSDEFVYDAHFLLRSWFALKWRTQIRVPEEIEELVERVYNLDATCPADVSPAVHEFWEQTRSEYGRSVEHDLDEARLRRVQSPKDDTAYTGRNLKLKEEDEAPHAEDMALALTRLGPPSVRVVLLPKKQAGRQWEAKGPPPDRRTTRSLLNQSVPISHGAVAPALIQQDPPTHWNKSPWLRHTRLVTLDDDGQATISTGGAKGKNPRLYTLRHDPDLGVVIRRQAAERT